MQGNIDLSLARDSKCDEFYTQYEDIESELQNYLTHFNNKVVYCNCDDPYQSNFAQYFMDNFTKLGLKKLIVSSYDNQSEELFTSSEASKAIWFEIDSPLRVGTSVEEIELKSFVGNGDFRSAECVELLREADIICTNPPFSLFREFLSQLVEYQKEYLIIGNMNAITYRDSFELIMSGKMWLGPSITSGDREFRIPDSYPVTAAGSRFDAETGQKFIRVKGVRWFTNIDHSLRHRVLELDKLFSPSIYPLYDNANVVDISKTKDIPKDYDGLMGVPISFLDKWNPDQFEILGIANSARWIGYPCLTVIDGVKKYNRIIIRNKFPVRNLLTAST